MFTFIMALATFITGYIVGHNMGVARTMLRIQNLILQLQEIESIFKNHQEQWNEDNL